MFNSISPISFARNYNAGSSRNLYTGANNTVSTKSIFGNKMGIMESKKPTVTIDGEQYPVEIVNDPIACDKTKRVVTVNGKQYPVEIVSDPIACDKTKAVVVIDGKQYDVNGNFGSAD